MNDGNMDYMEAWLRGKAAETALLAEELKCLPADGLDRFADAAGAPVRGRKPGPPRPGEMGRIVAGLTPVDAKDAMVLDAVATAVETMRDVLLSEILSVLQFARLEAEDATPELTPVRAALDGCIVELKRRKNRTWNPAKISEALAAPMAWIAADCRTRAAAGRDPGRHAKAAGELADRAGRWLARLL